MELRTDVDMHGCPIPPPLTRAEVLRLVLFVVAVLAVIAALFAVLLVLLNGLGDLSCLLDGCDG